MDIFVVRLNPDPREGVPYSNFVSEKEYKKIHSSSPMDGFHEAVNFMSEGGVIRGYLPPRHSAALRNGELFVLVTITAKTAKKGGNQIVGIQSGCIYEGETEREGASHKQGLTWHYRCPASLSYLFPNPIPFAREIVLGQDGSWVRGPTYKIPTGTEQKFLASISTNLKGATSKAKLKAILRSGDAQKAEVDFEAEDTFEQKVSEEFGKPSKKVKGNKHPTQKEVKTYAYVRDPKVVAQVLREAKGICFDCENKGPFISKVTGQPYLEVHHVQMLKDGGPDTPENVVALCPNCHRARHYG
ncbi:HNH endonuclease [Halomonas sp. N3-2A]|uniref:HNH endonuclease n=1 Tax=Halomonas sp. N3-2A TaxID=2014541 RepID=UPI000B5B0F67|nr:HNH endonuclease signature motif containing protein [Halomonas sp. N3-2A]ASK18475.1 restriction endonuclease [Halomonas sp. N3-2A]